MFCAVVTVIGKAGGNGVGAFSHTFNVKRLKGRREREERSVERRDIWIGR